MSVARRLAALLVLAAPLMAPPAASATDLIVRRDPGLSAAERADVRADAGVDFEHRLRLPDTEVVSVLAADAAEALSALRADPDARCARIRTCAGRSATTA